MAFHKLNMAIVNIIWRIIKGYGLLNFLLVEQWVTSIFGVKVLYKDHLQFLIKKCQLFDPVYYLEMNPDLVEKNNSPLKDYIISGDRKGRWPMPFFDPQYYRSQLKSKIKPVNALLHYVYIGRYLRISPSPWFDVNFYLKENKDVERSGMDPILHYLKWGGAEGRSPNLQFDGSYYLRANPDVKEARVNPLLHYLRVGRFEGRSTALQQPLGKQAYKTYQKAVDTISFDSQHILSKQARVDAKIDIIVPVYKDQELTLRTIYSVLMAKVEIIYELIVINDCSPEPELVLALEALNKKKLITLLHNDENSGFVRTVNRGMRLHPERDVLLLNADTEVFNNWLDRLYAAAYRDQSTGTVTPLSNNATICSYPCFLNDNPYPLELSYEQLDELAATVNDRMETDAPTAVGFCMYVRRDCLNAVGLFDEKTFGRGYGEENDFCQRAIAKGWRNIIAADTFVRHWGSASFQGEKAERIVNAKKTLYKLHPQYKQQLIKFTQQDPLARDRERLDWARLLRQVKQKNVLIVCHARGGGSERHVQEDTLRLLKQDIGAFFLRPVVGKPTHVRLGHPTCPQLFNLKSYSLADIDTLAVVLAKLNITRIHTHGLVDFTIDAPQHILSLVQRLKAEFWVDLHDYKVICPRINLTNRAGRYCGEPREVYCNLCCETERNDFSATDIKAWRDMHYNVLQQADKIWVPDIDVQQRLLRYFPKLSMSVSPHEELDVTNIKLVQPRINPDSKLRIVVIGAIGKIKGFHIFLACACDAKKRKLPLEFVLLGYSLKDKVLEECGVTITGRYLEHDAKNKLKTLQGHVAWLPSTWPETYSYTLSLALDCGYPVFAFDIGAIATRLRALGQEQTLIPLQLQDSPQVINNHFVKYLRNCQQDNNES